MPRGPTTTWACVIHLTIRYGRSRSIGIRNPIYLQVKSRIWAPEYCEEANTQAPLTAWLSVLTGDVNRQNVRRRI